MPCRAATVKTLDSMINTILMPVTKTGTLIKTKNFLAKQGMFCKLRSLATVLNRFPLCRLKLRNYKFLPGSAIGCLFTVASFQAPITPGGLVFTPSICYQNLRHMFTNTSQANPAYLDTFYALTDEQQQRHRAIKDHIEYVSAWLSGSVDICPIVPRVGNPQGIVLPFVNLKNVAI